MPPNAELLTGTVRQAHLGPVAMIRIGGAGVADPDNRVAAADSYLERNIHQASWSMVPRSLENMLRWDLGRRGDLEHALD